MVTRESDGEITFGVLVYGSRPIIKFVKTTRSSNLTHQSHMPNALTC